MIEHLMKPNTEDGVLPSLANAAVEATKEDDVLLTVRRDNPESCLMCKATKGLTEQVISTKLHTDVMLLCPGCVPNGSMSVIDLMQAIRDMSETGQLETFFIYEVGGKVNVLTDDLRRMEVPSGTEG